MIYIHSIIVVNEFGLIILMEYRSSPGQKRKERKNLVSQGK